MGEVMWVGGGGGGEVKGVGLFIGSILEFCRSQNKSCFERCLIFVVFDISFLLIPCRRPKESMRW